MEHPPHHQEKRLNPDIHGLWPALLLPLSAQGALDTPRAIAHARRMLARPAVQEALIL